MKGSDGYSSSTSDRYLCSGQSVEQYLCSDQHPGFGELDISVPGSVNNLGDGVR